MTVAELMEELQQCNPDAIVSRWNEYGDYYFTDEALEINHVTEYEAIKEVVLR